MFYILLYILPYRNPSRINIIPSPLAARLSERGVVLREVLVAVSVLNGLRRAALRQGLSIGLAVGDVVGATVVSEVGRLCDRSRMSISGNVGGVNVDRTSWMRGPPLESVPVRGALQKAPQRYT